MLDHQPLGYPLCETFFSAGLWFKTWGGWGGGGESNLGWKIIITLHQHHNRVLHNPLHTFGHTPSVDLCTESALPTNSASVSTAKSVVVVEASGRHPTLEARINNIDLVSYPDFSALCQRKLPYSAEDIKLDKGYKHPNFTAAVVMRILETTSPLLCFLAIITTTSRARAAALPPEEQLASSEGNVLVERQCAIPCGFYGQVCCGANEACYTDGNNQAQCGPAGSVATAAAGQGNWQYYTTTYVQTDLRTITTTFSSFFPISTQNFVFSTTAASQCRASLGEVPCGNTCCSAGQYCMTNINQCAAAGGGSSGFYSSFYTVTQNPSVPVRPTSNTILTVTATGSPTTTVPFQTPVGTDGSTLIGVEASTQGGLSGGAIAGIVIGVIAGIILLLLICLCWCGGAAISALRGIFGGGRKRRTETTVIKERHSHHGHSHHGSRPAGRTWFGARPARVDRTEKRNTGGALAGFAKVGLALGGLAAVLGLKRRSDRRRNEAKSESDYTYDYDSYITSESELTHGLHSTRASY